MEEYEHSGSGRVQVCTGQVGHEFSKSFPRQHNRTLLIVNTVGFSRQPVTECTSRRSSGPALTPGICQETFSFVTK